MNSPFDILQALEGPAAVLDPAGAPACANAAFARLDAAGVAAALAGEEGWRVAPLAGGGRLVTAVDPRVARRGRMLATLSHEIRTPLNGVLGMAGLLGATELNATQRAYLAALRDSGEHLLGLVGDVLDYARLDAGRLELEPAPTDPERLLQGVCELLSPRAHAGGIEIAWALDPQAPPPTLMADDGRLRQVLFNLAGNAVKLTRTGGVLLGARVAGVLADGRVQVRFSVRDTGPGLSPAAQARVFEEFEQEAAGAEAGGAGLGLAIVRRIVDALGGRLGVESREGQGAEFWMEAAFAVAPAAGSASPGASPDAEGRGALAGQAVGVVSPSPIVRAAAALQVEACGGRALPAEAFAALEGERLDAVLVDAAGAAPPAPPPGAPAYVLLAPEERDRIAPARAAGYAGYLIKPLRRASLAGRLAQAPAPAHDAPAPQAGGDDERIDAAPARGARVLLAEDNPVNALLARALLQREGCEVDRAATGEEALAACDRGGYDLVLMDLRMPGLGGLAAAAALRARGDATPVVALTANAFDEDRRACLAAGMNDFLVKPLDAAALRAALARWAGRRPARADAA